MSTKYRHLSNTEFLALISRRIGHSPIVDELYQRFQAALDKTICPICETNIDEIKTDDIPF
jgi:hypothetical protein